MTPSCSGSDQFVLLNFSACHNRDLCLCQHLFRQLRLSGDLKTFYSSCYTPTRHWLEAKHVQCLPANTCPVSSDTLYTSSDTSETSKHLLSNNCRSRQLLVSDNCSSPRRSARDNCRRRPNSAVTVRWVAGGRRAIVISS